MNGDSNSKHDVVHGIYQDLSALESILDDADLSDEVQFLEAYAAHLELFRARIEDLYRETFPASLPDPTGSSGPGTPLPFVGV